VQLPAELQSAIDVELTNVSSKALAAAVGELSRRYRTGRGSGVGLGSDQDIAAYVAYRVPATFAAIGAVFEEARDRLPDLRPASLLDVGAGPGTAGWAAVQVWPDLERIVALERDPRTIRMGRALAAHSSSAAVRDASWRQADVTALQMYLNADVAEAAYLMGELGEEARVEVVRRLWRSSGAVCAIVEPGTPRGSELIRRAGEQLAGLGAHILAPFPPGWDCLASEDDWIHFAARVPRTRRHRLAKGGELPYEDEKYAYLVAARTSGEPIAARVIRHPQIRSGHIRLVLCTAQGRKEVVVTRANREAYRRSKELTWGSAILPEDPLPLSQYGRGGRGVRG
jgi:ribosomal protein RSM22 (predicted rRNA methylase)